MEYIPNQIGGRQLLSSVSANNSLKTGLQFVCHSSQINTYTYNINSSALPCMLFFSGFSVFDLLEDDGLDGNGKDNPGHEAHVAFSIEGIVRGEQIIRSIRLN